VPLGLKNARRGWPRTFWSVLTVSALVVGSSGAFAVFYMQAKVDTGGKIAFDRAL
jgi:hypothetical protein